MYTLTCPLPLFRRVLGRLALAPTEAVALLVGASCVGSEFTWLARSMGPHPSSGAGEAGIFLVRLQGQSISEIEDGNMRGPVEGRLALTSNPSEARVTGDVSTPAGPHPLDRLVLPGPGMHVLWCHEPLGPRIFAEGLVLERSLTPDLWRRTIGALGDEEIWRRLVQLRIGIVGCGRTGSVVATLLAQLGVRDLMLIDSDHLEPHNLGEMIGVHQVGQPKVNLVARHLRRTLAVPGDIVPIVRSIKHEEAIAATKTRDVLVCAVDNDAARLMTAFVAAFHHKILIDIGTGVFRRHTDEQQIARHDSGQDTEPEMLRPGAAYDRAMGADVRIVLPGDGCLRCRGGLADYDNALRDLCGLPPREAPGRGAARERAGSLLTLNAMAAAIGVQMLQDLVADRLRVSTWAHLEYDQSGQVGISYPTPWSPGAVCLLCERAGLGDAGV